MEILIFGNRFAVCKVADTAGIDFSAEYFFISKTPEEISIVCREECIPQHVLEKETGWICFKINGVLDFSLVGIIAKISNILAKQGISIFVLSTFNTDYFLIKETKRDEAVMLLRENDYTVKLWNEANA